MNSQLPVYRQLTRNEFTGRVESLRKIMRFCRLCPRKCGVNRLAGEKGYCQARDKLEISSYGAHYGEESVLVGEGGSGTIFLTWCNLRCCFCQNQEISLLGQGRIVSIQECAEIMLRLQERGCHNINLVTPSHYAPQLVEAIFLASAAGLSLPVVWNCSGYENVEVLKLLDGIIDIYMPDLKYNQADTAKLLSNAPDYVVRSRESIREMYRQVGDLLVVNGLAAKGLLVRHLILPGKIEESLGILDFIAKEISFRTYVNVMSQYHPCGVVPADLNRPLFLTEYQKVVEKAVSLGLTRGLK
ncbi:MAG: radical SAM protein [Candidatus Omnitrophica bacterium]|nr:radical SAM protein [Candidatus Omnitrophota bacterium]